jgi:hypothetical protein
MHLSKKHKLFHIPFKQKLNHTIQGAAAIFGKFLEPYFGNQTLS